MADSKSSETAIVEERQELMIDATSSLANQTPTSRIAHFLKPSLNPTSSSLPPFPEIPTFSHSSNPTNVVFTGNSTPVKNWQTWVEKLQETHEPAWRKAGIFDAIKGSNYHIIRDTDLIFTLAEKWCPETNTFILPWGEITVTLEDVMILGGFSTLGESVSGKSSVGHNVEHLVNNLITCHQRLSKIGHNVSHYKWMEYFIGLGGDIENAGCLSVWLARHVFQSKSRAIVSRKVLPVAARLSCGVKIALAPAVLASIYRDLTLLKERIVSCLTGECDDYRCLRLSAPLQLVQVWAWERFPSLGPVPRTIRLGETRLARWRDFCCKADNFNMVACLDSARDTFLWRPYAVSLENWSLPGFYVESGTWVEVDSDEEWKSFACCLMVCDLVGLDSYGAQGYNPHRVALQFGFDQDIPDPNRNDGNLQGLRSLYLPPRLYEGVFTHRYSNWWRTGFQSLLGEAFMGCKRRKRSLKNTKKRCKLVMSNPGIGWGSSYSEFTQPNDEAKLVTGLLRESEMRIFPCILAEAEKYEVADHDAEMARLSEMFLGKKQGNGVVNHQSSCGLFNEFTVSEDSPGHQYLASEVGDIIVMSSQMTVVRPEGDTGKHQHNVSEEDEEESIVELVHEPRNEASTEAYGTTARSNAPTMETLCLLVPKDEPGTPLNQYADINHVINLVNDGETISVDEENGDHESIVALCHQFELRISRLERDISCMKAANLII